MFTFVCVCHSSSCLADTRTTREPPAPLGWWGGDGRITCESWNASRCLNCRLICSVWVGGQTRVCMYGQIDQVTAVMAVRQGSTTVVPDTFGQTDDKSLCSRGPPQIRGGARTIAEQGRGLPSTTVSGSCDERYLVGRGGHERSRWFPKWLIECCFWCTRIPFFSSRRDAAYHLLRVFSEARYRRLCTTLSTGLVSWRTRTHNVTAVDCLL